MEDKGAAEKREYRFLSQYSHAVRADLVSSIAVGGNAVGAKIPDQPVAGAAPSQPYCR